MVLVGETDGIMLESGTRPVGSSLEALSWLRLDFRCSLINTNSGKTPRAMANSEEGLALS